MSVPLALCSWQQLGWTAQASKCNQSRLPLIFACGCERCMMTVGIWLMNVTGCCAEVGQDCYAGVNHALYQNHAFGSWNIQQTHIQSCIMYVHSGDGWGWECACTRML